MFDENKLWSNLSGRSPDECWNWLGTTIHHGYGLIRKDNKMQYTHRVAYLLFYGEFDPKLKVCHKCDNPSCCNPNHLFLGTQKDNTQDMISKGRQNFINNLPKGPKIWKRKLSDDEVMEIKNHASFHGVNTHLANLYKVSISTISLIRRGKARS